MVTSANARIAAIGLTAVAGRPVLPWAGTKAERFAAWFVDNGYTRVVGGEGGRRAVLATISDALRADRAVIYMATHGVEARTPHLEVGPEGGASERISGTVLGRRIAAGHASNVLLVLDACYSDLIADAVQRAYVAERRRRGLSLADRHLVVLPTAMDDGPSFGRFVDRFLHVVKSPTLGHRQGPWWSVNALAAELHHMGQGVGALRHIGVGPESFVPNRFRDALNAITFDDMGEHLLPAYDGFVPWEACNWLVNRLSGRRRLVVLQGSPGSGKSALLAWLTLASVGYVQDERVERGMVSCYEHAEDRRPAEVVRRLRGNLVVVDEVDQASDPQDLIDRLVRRAGEGGWVVIGVRSRAALEFPGSVARLHVNRSRGYLQMMRDAIRGELLGRRGGFSPYRAKEPATLDPLIEEIRRYAENDVGIARAYAHILASRATVIEPDELHYRPRFVARYLNEIDEGAEDTLEAVSPLAFAPREGLSYERWIELSAALGGRELSVRDIDHYVDVLHDFLVVVDRDGDRYVSFRSRMWREFVAGSVEDRAGWERRVDEVLASG